MIICVDFDGVCVHMGAYDDSWPRMIAGAREGLEALKRAGHVLVLCSGRANRSLRVEPELDPLVRSGVRRAASRDDQELNDRRHQVMLDFVEAELPRLFAAIDDGWQGKVSADMYIDDRAVRFGVGLGAMGWRDIGERWGE